MKKILTFLFISVFIFNINAQNKINGHEYVDLGLSVKWATCNVGASRPHHYGNYYAWGETSTKREYASYNSRHFGHMMRDLSYHPNCDVAHTNWGGSWRLPSRMEMEELKNKCTWKWITQNGVNGYKVMGPNGNSIFLPAAGGCEGSSPYDVGECGYYWSSWPGTNFTDYGFYLGFRSDVRKLNLSPRYVGFRVRPVTK